MTVTITRRYQFEAAHFLPHVPDGHKCKNMHGHTYVAEVSVTGDLIEGNGMVMDFAEIDAKALPLFKLLDHTVVNDTIANPTAEIISAWILGGLPFASKVRVYENPNCWAECERSYDNFKLPPKRGAKL